MIYFVFPHVSLESVSYTGLGLQARELSQHMVSMGGAHADFRETSQAFRCYIELGAHLQGQGFVSDG